MVRSREEHIVAFLKAHGWQHCERQKIPGDASFRCYERLVMDGKHAILMDAPPTQENIRPFVKIARYLRSLDLNAPEILAEDEENGLLLLQDFGNESFTKILNGTSSLSGKYDEKTLYQRAVDVLIHLQQASHLPEDVAPYNEAVLKREVSLLTQWFLPHIDLYDDAQLKTLEDEYFALWSKLYPFTFATKQATVYRDYHADNLMWLEEEKDIKAVGLLDFQDALIGSTAYDLVSLLEDARRDVSPAIQSEMLDYFIQKTGLKDADMTAFKTAYAVLGAQRNSKIVGIFCRLAIRDGKSRYLSYLPRVWAHLEHDLSHPALAELKQWFDRVIPKGKRQPENFTLPEKEVISA